MKNVGLAQVCKLVFHFECIFFSTFCEKRKKFNSVTEFADISLIFRDNSIGTSIHIVSFLILKMKF